MSFLTINPGFPDQPSNIVESLDALLPVVCVGSLDGAAEFCLGCSELSVHLLLEGVSSGEEVERCDVQPVHQHSKKRAGLNLVVSTLGKTQGLITGVLCHPCLFAFDDAMMVVTMALRVVVKETRGRMQKEELRSEQ